MRPGSPRSLNAIALLLFCSLLPSCSTQSVLVVTNTSLGVAITATSDKTGDVNVGYKRFEGVYVPMERAEDGTMPEPPAVYSRFKLDAKGLTPGQMGHLTVKQVFATGEAAEEAGVPAVAAEAFR